jgi:hypothetical protein
MPIAGFETLENVLGALSGLEHEKPRNEEHAAAIAESKARFEKERDRMLKEERERDRAREPSAAREAGARMKPAPLFWSFRHRQSRRGTPFFERVPLRAH